MVSTVIQTRRRYYNYHNYQQITISITTWSLAFYTNLALRGFQEGVLVDNTFKFSVEESGRVTPSGRQGLRQGIPLLRPDHRLGFRILVALHPSLEFRRLTE